MPLIAVVVGAIGTAVGTAVGTAIGGSILGVSMATIGGVIGAGIAGGALAAATGGSFGKGFLMGAAGAAIGGFLKGGLGDATGASMGEAGTTAIETGVNEAGYLAPEMGTAAVEGVTDAATGGAGLGDLASGGMSSTGTGDLFGTGMGEVAPSMSTAPTAEGSFSLENLSGAAQPAADSFSLSAMPTDTASAGIGYTPTPSLGTDQFALTPGMTTEAPLLSTDYAPAPMESAGGMEGTAPSWAGDTGGTTTAGSYPMSYQEPTPQPQSSGGLGGMFKSSDAWLKENLGMPQGSTGKLLMGGADALMKNYQADKLQRQVKGMAPMSFEQYSAQFSNPDDYRQASAKMAQSGRTGTLPALLARMKERTRAGYAGYLPGAQQQYLQNTAAVGNMKQGAVGSMFRPLSQLDWSNA